MDPDCNPAPNCFPNPEETAQHRNPIDGMQPTKDYNLDTWLLCHGLEAHHGMLLKQGFTQPTHLLDFESVVDIQAMVPLMIGEMGVIITHALIAYCAGREALQLWNAIKALKHECHRTKPEPEVTLAPCIIWNFGC